MSITFAALYDWLLFAHILSAMLWIGGIVVLAALVLRTVRAGEPGGVGRFVGQLRAIGPPVLAPPPVVLIASAVWLVADSDTWGFDQLWIQLALALFGAAFLIGAAHQSRTAIAAERAAARGDEAEAARQLRRWAWGTAVILLLLVVATWDMVFRPGL
jgi:uncharacterized membrane protein